MPQTGWTEPQQMPQDQRGESVVSPSQPPCRRPDGLSHQDESDQEGEGVPVPSLEFDFSQVGPVRRRCDREEESPREDDDDYPVHRTPSIEERLQADVAAGTDPKLDGYQVEEEGEVPTRPRGHNRALVKKEVVDQKKQEGR